MNFSRLFLKTSQILLIGYLSFIAISVSFGSSPLISNIIVMPSNPAAPNTVLTLDGSTSTGPVPLNYNWIILSNPPTSVASIANPNNSSTTFTPTVPGTYTIQLTVSYGGPSPPPTPPSNSSSVNIIINVPVSGPISFTTNRTPITMMKEFIPPFKRCIKPEISK